MSRNDQLPIPPAAAMDPHSFEVLRVWVANGDQHVTLKVAAWDDPAAWGLLLADLAKHVANGYQAHSRRDPTETLRRIKAGLDAELASPTDDAIGELLDSEEPKRGGS